MDEVGVFEEATIVRVGDKYAWGRTNKGEEIFLSIAKLRLVVRNNGGLKFIEPPAGLKRFFYGEHISFKREKGRQRPGTQTPVRDQTQFWVYSSNLSTGEMPDPRPFYRLIRRSYGSAGEVIEKGEIQWTGYDVNDPKLSEFWDVEENPTGEAVIGNVRTTFGFDVYLDGVWHSCPDPRQESR